MSKLEKKKGKELLKLKACGLKVCSSLCLKLYHISASYAVLQIDIGIYIDIDDIDIDR